MKSFWPGLTVACLLAFAAPAHAATTIGAVAHDLTPPNEPENCAPNTEFMQQSIGAGGESYDAPFTGVITSWSTNVGASTGTSARLKVYRPTASPDTWTVVGESPLKVLTPSTVNTAGTRIPVRAGDRIAIRTGAPNGGPCYFPYPDSLDAGYTTFSFQSFPSPPVDPPSGSDVTFFSETFQHQLINIAAVVEADADGDGFGDETQDDCPGLAGSSDGCPPPAQPAPPVQPAVPLPVPIALGARAGRTQHVLRQRGIVITVSPNVASSVSATATVQLPGGTAVVRFTRATKQAPAGVRTTLKLKLSKKALARVRKALARHRKLRAKAVVKATAPEAGPVTSRSSIRLIP